MKNYKKYKTVFLTNWQSVLAYRNSFYFWALFSLVPFFLMYFLWTTVYSNHGAIKGYNLNDLILYFFAVLIVKRLTTVYVEWSLSFRIKSGMLSTFLVKPISVVRYFFAMNLSQELLELIITIPFVLIAFLLFKNYLSFPSLEFGLYFLISVAFSFILGFLISFLLGCLAFWHEEADGFFYMKETFLSFLSGAVLPLDFFSDGLARILKVLPFNYLVYFPVNIFLQKISRQEILYGFFNGFCWILVMAIALKYTYKKGVIKYSAVGN